MPKKKPKTPTPTETALATISATVSSSRRRISSQDRRFVDLYADRGFKDAYDCLKLAGFKRPGKVDQILHRLRDIIEAERLRRVMATQMELDEALIGTADLARLSEDSRVRLAAYRTILEVHGALGNKPISPASRTDLARQVAEIVDRVGKRVGASPGAKARVRAVLSATDGGTSAAIEVEESQSQTSASAAADPQIQ